MSHENDRVVKCPITDLPCRNPECTSRHGHCDLDKNPFSQKELLRKTLADMKQDFPHCQPISVHVHNDFGSLLESFLSIHQKLDKIMSTQTELAAQVQAISAQVSKIGEESKVTLQKVIDLETALANQDNVSPELQAAVDALKKQVQVVDDLVADAPPAEQPTA